MIYPHSVDIIRAASSTDAYGDPTLDWDTATTTSEVPAWVQPRTTSEVTGGRSAVLTEWMAFLPPETDVAAHDRLRWEGRLYDVDGDPAYLWNPSGPHHVEVPLTRITG